jgi:hypothetical protein
MTCKVCNKGTRIYHKGTLECPVCNGIKLLDSSKKAKEIEASLKENLSRLKWMIKHSNYNKVLLGIVNFRELAARSLIADPDDGRAARIWLSCLFILANLDSENQKSEDFGVTDILNQSMNTLETISKLEFLRQNKLVYLESGEECSTELQILYRTSSEVEKTSFEDREINGPESLKRYLEKVLKLSMAMFKEAIQSDSLSRNLSTILPKYLLPYKDKKDFDVINGISYNLVGLIASFLGSQFQPLNGVMTVPKDRYDEIAAQLSKQSGHIASHFLYPRTSNFEGSNLGLNIIVYDPIHLEFKLPYYSLLLLTKIVYRDISNLDDYHRMLGDGPEEWINKLLRGHLKTKNPMNGEELIRLKLGKKKGEIDDIAFNDTVILVIESKFRETLNVQELERELDKFEKSVDDFEGLKASFGFASSQKVIPIFYTPWPPFSTYGKHNIMIIPSIGTLIEYLVNHFPPIERPYAKPTAEISEFLERDRENRLFISDLSNYMDLEKDMYRIQDIQVLGIEGHEIDAFVFFPSLNSVPLTFDVDDDCLVRLKRAGVKEGTVLRVVFFNQQDYWVKIQIVDFRVIKLDSHIDPDNVLTELNSKEYEEFVARLVAGVNAEELLRFARKNGINLRKYIQWAEASGHNIYSAVGNLLSRSATPDSESYQCDCGEVTTLPKLIVIKMKGLYGNNLKCKNCDPDLLHKVEFVSGKRLQVLPFGNGFGMNKL